MQANTLDKAYQLELETGIRKAGSKCRYTASIHSLGTRYIKIEGKWKKDYGKSDLEIQTMIESHTGQTRAGRQLTMSQFLSKN